MENNVMYRMALANDAATINKYATDLGLAAQYREIAFGHAAFGVIAAAEKEGTVQTVGAAWAVMVAENVRAFIHVVDEYDSVEVRNELRMKLHEKAMDRGIGQLVF